MADPPRHYTQIEQDVMRACHACSEGYVNLVGGRVACALVPPKDCVLPKALAAVLSEDPDGPRPIARLATPEWVAAHRAVEEDLPAVESPAPPAARRK